MELADRKKQGSLQEILAFIVLMPAFLGFINVLLPVLGFGEITSICTALIYIGVLFVLIIKAGLTLTDFAVLLMIYCTFFFSYIMFPSTRTEFVTQGMIILFLFFIPYCVIGIRKIRVFETFFSILGNLSIITIIIGIFMFVFLPYQRYLDYMEYSYSLLPAICAVYYIIHFRKFNSSNRRSWKIILYYICLIAGMLEMLAFGARAPVAFSLIYMFLCVICDKKESFSKKTIFSALYIVCAFIGIVFIENIITNISSFSVFSNSYILRRYLTGRLIVSTSREGIWASCFQRLENMGFSISGFFGDRAFCAGIYPHNIFLEVLMSWGWVIGGFIILFFLILVVRGMKMNREVTLFFLCSMFSRYLLSGTYIREGKFWITLFVLIAITSRKEIKLIFHR